MIAICVLVKQVYFTLSLKKVRSWLESKTPIELDKNLKQYKFLRIFFIILITLVLAGSITQGILDFYDINISSEISKIFAFSFFFAVVFMIL